MFLFHEEEIKQLELETSEDNENGRYQEVSAVPEPLAVFVVVLSLLQTSTPQSSVLCTVRSALSMVKATSWTMKLATITHVHVSRSPFSRSFPASLPVPLLILCLSISALCFCLSLFPHFFVCIVPLAEGNVPCFLYLQLRPLFLIKGRLIALLQRGQPQRLHRSI